MRLGDQPEFVAGPAARGKREQAQAGRISAIAIDFQQALLA
jgi:hypothetical protein